MTGKNRLQILIAGCSPDERERVEARVKAALGPHAASGAWTVSLVKLQRIWSVTLDGPDGRGKSVSLEAPDDQLQTAIREALAGAGTRSSAAPRSSASPPSSASPRSSAGPTPSPDPSAQKRDEYTCPSCGRGFRVVYETQPNEPAIKAPVACPTCWHVSKVTVAEGAGATGDYRAEAL